MEEGKVLGFEAEQFQGLQERMQGMKQRLQGLRFQSGKRSGMGKRSRTKGQRFRNGEDHLQIYYLRPGILEPHSAEESGVELRRVFRDRGFNSWDELHTYLWTTPDGPRLVPLPPSPAEQAQDIAYRAWSEEGPERLDLAYEALETSPDCADAYLILALAGVDPAKNLELARAAVERTFLDPGDQDLYSVVTLRPYLRIQVAYARYLADTGQPERALARYRELLQRSPEDGQGVRYHLLRLLLALGRDDEAWGLLDTNPDETAEWSYNRLLVAWRREGDTARTQRILAESLARNPLVPAALLGPVPLELPEWVAKGNQDEAAAYAVELGRVWHEVPRALDYLS